MVLAEKANLSSTYSILLILFATPIILLIRKTDALTNPQFWAEDGVIFFLQQYDEETSVLFQEYAGYLLFVPRFIALIADTFFSYSLIPAVYNYSSLLITVISVLSIFSSRIHMNNKLLMALTISLIPHHANEIFLNITNLQWILSIMIIIVLFKASPSSIYGNIAAQYIYDLVIIIFCGLTGPFIILLTPFFVWKWLSEKNLYTAVMLLSAIIISLIQLSFIIPSSINALNISSDFSAYSEVIGYKVLGGLFLGSKISYKLNPYLLSFLYLGMMMFILYLAYQKKNRFIFFYIGISLIYLLATFYKFRDNPGVLIPPGNGVRYFYVPYVMLTWSLIALLEQRELWKSILLKIGLVLIVMSSLTSQFHSKPFIDYNWALYSKSIGKAGMVIPINPVGWQITIKAQPK